MVSHQVYDRVTAAFIAAATAWAVRLFRLHLVRVYPAVFGYVALQIVSAILSLVIGPATAAYAWVYLIFAPLIWLVSGLMMKQLYASVFTHFPGVAYLGRWSIYGAAAVTAITSTLTIAVARRLFADQHTLLIVVEFAGHCVTFGLAAMAALLLFMISKYPLTLHRNVMINCLLFSGIFLGEAVGLLIHFFTQQRYTALVNVLTTLEAAACFTVWCFLLSPEGETRVFRIRRRYTLDDEHRLMKQLNAINSALLRLAGIKRLSAQ